MFIAFIFILLILLFIGFYLPLTFDEAWHYLYLHDKSIIQIMNYYTFPNNHIFYTILLHLLPFNNLLSINPHVIRLLTIITTVILFILINRIIRIRKPLYLLLLFLVFINFNPFITIYSVESRGYMLGVLLLLWGIYLMSKERIYLSVVPFILSAYTIPTFGYVLPGIWIYLVLWKRWKKALVHFIIVSSSIFLLYLPIIDQLEINARKWNNVSFLHFVKVTFLSFLSFPNSILGVIFSTFFILLLTFCFIQTVKRSSLFTIYSIFLLSIISYFLVTFLTVVFLKNDPPFERNGLFISVFIFIFSIQQIKSQQNGLLRNVVFIMLLINTSFGLLTTVSYLSFPSYLPGAYPISVNAYPSLRTADCLLYSSWRDEPVSLYLARSYHISAKPLNSSNLKICCNAYKADYKAIDPLYDRVISICTKKK